MPCSVALATPLARLESPAPEAFLRSGIALIRGWSCDAGRVEVSIDGGPLLATAQGTDRPDTAQTCGRTDTGFGLIYNWNRVGDGVHELRAFVGGVEFADVNFTVATLGGEFLTGLRGDYTVPDFPAPGDSAKIGWSEPHQNFVFVSPVTVPPVANPPKLSGAALESPVQGSSESGIGLIRGWVCTAGKVEVSLDGGPLMATAHGTDRPDTAGTCGRADTGFGLTYQLESGRGRGPQPAGVRRWRGIRRRQLRRHHAGRRVPDRLARQDPPARLSEHRHRRFPSSRLGNRPGHLPGMVRARSEFRDHRFHHDRRQNRHRGRHHRHPQQIRGLGNRLQLVEHPRRARRQRRAGSAHRYRRRHLGRCQQ
ncbi:MAG: hypothetical protein V9H25_12985 [Candidatus Competibacter sp.]